MIGLSMVPQIFSVGQPASSLIGGGKVDAASPGVGVVLAQDTFSVDEGALIQWDGLIQPPSILVAESEVVAREQGVGVGLAQDPLEVSEIALIQGDGLIQPTDGLIG